MNLQRFDNDGLELIINTTTGESFASISGYARLSGKAQSTISGRIAQIKPSENSIKSAEISTTKGMRTVRLISEDLIIEWLPKDNPEMATKLLKLGVRMFLHNLAGFEYQVKQQVVEPKSSISPALIVAREFAEITNLVESNPKLAQLLSTANLHQLKRYFKFIASMFSRITPEGYCETHHIIPRCIGGTDEPSNLIDLTAREHFIAHHLLAKAFRTPQLYAALAFMSSKGKLNNRQFEICKIACGRAAAERNRNKKQSEATIAKRVSKLIGKKRTDNIKQLLSEQKKGSNNPMWKKDFTKEHRAKLSLAARERKDFKHSEASKQLIGQKAKIRCKAEGNPAYDHTIYKLHNPELQICYFGTRYHFYTTYNFNKASIHGLFKGISTKYKGWYLVK